MFDYLMSDCLKSYSLISDVSCLIVSNLNMEGIIYGYKNTGSGSQEVLDAGG